MLTNKKILSVCAVLAGLYFIGSMQEPPAKVEEPVTKVQVPVAEVTPATVPNTDLFDHKQTVIRWQKSWEQEIKNGAKVIEQVKIYTDATQCTEDEVRLPIEDADKTHIVMDGADIGAIYGEEVCEPLDLMLNSGYTKLVSDTPEDVGYGAVIISPTWYK